MRLTWNLLYDDSLTHLYAVVAETTKTLSIDLEKCWWYNRGGATIHEECMRHHQSNGLNWNWSMILLGLKSRKNPLHAVCLGMRKINLKKLNFDDEQNQTDWVMQQNESNVSQKVNKVHMRTNSIWSNFNPIGCSLYLLCTFKSIVNNNFD